MKLNFNIENQNDYSDILKNLTAVVSDYFKLPSNIELDLTFLNSEEIKIINKEQRNIDKPTDVLSFPFLSLKNGEIKISEHKCDINPETNNLMLGEILICDEIAKAAAEEYNHSLMREICYLYIHGLLHLLGFDHIADSDKLIMRTHEEKILNVLNIGR